MIIFSRNIFSFFMAIITLCFTLPYPLTPSQLSLVSSVTAIILPAEVVAVIAEGASEIIPENAVEITEESCKNKVNVPNSIDPSHRR